MISLETMKKLLNRRFPSKWSKLMSDTLSSSSTPNRRKFAKWMNKIWLRKEVCSLNGSPTVARAIIFNYSKREELKFMKVFTILSQIHISSLTSRMCHFRKPIPSSSLYDSQKLENLSRSWIDREVNYGIFALMREMTVFFFQSKM